LILENNNLIIDDMKNKVTFEAAMNDIYSIHCGAIGRGREHCTCIVDGETYEANIDGAAYSADIIRRYQNDGLPESTEDLQEYWNCYSFIVERIMEVNTEK
jgi:hypothetical protein